MDNKTLAWILICVAVMVYVLTGSFENAFIGTIFFVFLLIVGISLNGS
jgi:hypothetical protein